MGRKTITVSEDTFEKADAQKPDGETWDRFVSELLEDAPDDVVQRLDELERQLPERVVKRLVDELNHR